MRLPMKSTPRTIWAMQMSKPFTDMPRMNALYERLKADGIITESPASGSAKDSGNKRRPIQPVRHGKGDRDTEEHAEQIHRQRIRKCSVLGGMQNPQIHWPDRRGQAEADTVLHGREG